MERRKYILCNNLLYCSREIFLRPEWIVDCILEIWIFSKAGTVINRLSVIWKSDLTDKMKRSFFQTAIVSILLYGCTTWTLTKRLEKKLNGNYTRMLRAILNKSWRQHPTKQQLYGHLPPITKTIKARRTRHAGYCWRSRDELISDVLLWNLSHGRAKAGRPAWTYIQQLCEDTGCSSEDLLEAMNNREEWRERVRDTMLMARQDGDDEFPDLWPFSNKLPLTSYRKCSAYVVKVIPFFVQGLYKMVH